MSYKSFYNHMMNNKKEALIVLLVSFIVFFMTFIPPLSKIIDFLSRYTSFIFLLIVIAVILVISQKNESKGAKDGRKCNLRLVFEKYSRTINLKSIGLISVDYILLINIALLFWLFLLCSYVLLSPFSDFQKVILINQISIWQYILTLFFIDISFSGIIIYLILKKNIEQNNIVIDNSNDDILTDDPIETNEQDLLGRINFVNQIKKEISELSNLKKYFVILINGRWGDGKTSVIKMLSNELKKDGNTYVISFDPWAYNNSDAIQKGFISEIEQTIKNDYFLDSNKDEFRKYLSAISTGFSCSNVLNIDVRNPCEVDQSIENIKKSLKAYINVLEKNFIVFIDDLDRLERDQLICVLKMIRLNMDINKFTYILSCSRDVVEEILNDKYCCESKSKISNIQDDYFDKFYQKQIDLPVIDKAYINSYLELCLFGSIGRIYLSMLSGVNIIESQNVLFEKEQNESGLYKFKEELSGNVFGFIKEERDRHLLLSLWNRARTNLFKIAGIDEKEIKIFNNDYLRTKVMINMLFDNLRDVKRFINNLHSILPVIKDEVFLFDFYILEVIRLFYPNVYSDIKENPRNYISISWAKKGTQYYDTIILSGEKRIEYLELIKRHVNDLILKEKNKDIIVTLLSTIFPEIYDAFNGPKPYAIDYYDETDFKNKRRIAHPDNFIIYFVYSIQGHIVTTALINDIEDKFNNTSQEQIGSYAKWLLSLGGIYGLDDVISKIELDNLEDEKKKYLLMLELANSKIITKNKALNTERGIIIRLILRYLDNQKDSKINSIANELVENILHESIIVEIVDHCINTKSYYKNIATGLDELIFIRKSSLRLNKMLEENNKNIFQRYDEYDYMNIVLLFGTSWGEYEYFNINNINKYIVGVFKSDYMHFKEFMVKLEILQYDDILKVLDLRKLNELNISIGHPSNDNKLFQNLISKQQKIATTLMFSSETTVGFTSNFLIVKTSEEEIFKEIEKFKLLILFLFEAGENKKLSFDSQNRILDYIKNGGYVIGVHDVVYGYYSRILSSVFGMANPKKYEEANVSVIPINNHVICSGVEKFVIKDERITVICPEEATVILTDEYNNPSGWLRTYGKGEIFCIKHGHYKEFIENKNVELILNNAIRYFISKE